MTLQKTRITVLAWIAVTIAVGVLAYLIGVNHSGSSTVTVTGPGIADSFGDGSGGTAYVGADEPLNKQPYGFAYSIAAKDLTWSDSSGTLHFGGPPPCLPFGKAVRVKDMEAVQVTIPQGTTTGTVVWVQC